MCRPLSCTVDLSCNVIDDSSVVGVADMNEKPDAQGK